MLERTTDHFRRWLHSRWTMLALGVTSFLEATVLPIPLEVLLIPLMQARRDRLWGLATVALLGCLAGALVGYGIGYGFMETVGEWLVGWLASPDALDRAREAMGRHGFWFILTVSVLPVPFQVAMLAAGATEYPLGLFVLAALSSRGVRYFGLALLVWWLGDAAEAWVRQHRWWATLVLVLLVAAGWGLTFWR